MDKKHLGTQTELQCVTYLHGLGYNISIPIGDNARYDFILDVNHHLYKIQCKTSSPVAEGVYRFKTCSTQINTKGNYTKFYTEDDIDFFCTYINNQCFLVPLSHTSRGGYKTMRFAKPKNGQVKGIVFAQEYLAEKVIQEELSKD